MMMTYECRIELNEIMPKIWREFKFHPDVTFHQLHKIIQIVMGWENTHLYEFNVNGQIIGVPDPDFTDSEEREFLNARREIVRKHIHEKNTVFTYVYDFSDNWHHTVSLMNTDITASDPIPICLDGVRSCPQEDVGGARRHQHMMEALQTPNHPEREHFMPWVREGFDAEHFSSEEVNRVLQSQKDKLIPKSLINRSVSKKNVKLTKPTLNKHLKQLNNDQLIDLVQACFEASKDIEKFLTVKILGNEAAESLFETYRKKVEHEFFPERGCAKLRLHEAKKAISEFEKLTGNTRYALELKLFYVEYGVDFILNYGDIDARLYNSIASMYAEIIMGVNRDDSAELFDEFDERLDAVVMDAQEIDWGFYEQMMNHYIQLQWV